MVLTFFIGGLNSGGSERVLCNLANYLAEKGNEVEIVTMAESSSYTLHSKISRVVLLKDCERSNFVANTFKRYIRLKRYVKKRKCDAYIVMLPITTILLLSLRRYIDAPIIASERAFPPIYSKFIRFMLKQIADRASGWVFQTPTVQSWYIPHLSKSKSVVIPNAVNTAFIRQPFEGKREQTIVSIGRLVPQKRFDLLISAFGKVASKYPDLTLVIYGEGPIQAQLQSLSSSLGLQDRVKFPGYIDNVPEILEKSRLFVLASEFEGIPNVLIEAMSLGVPCISTDCDGGGARMLVKNGENGLLIPKNNLEALVNAMDEVLSDKEFSKKLANNAVRIRDEYAPEVIYRKWEDFINSIIALHND